MISGQIRTMDTMEIFVRIVLFKRETKESCGWFCTNWIYTVPSMSSIMTFEVTGRNSFWSSWNKNGSLDQAITYVNAGISVMAVDVRNYMHVKGSASGNGYIKYQDHNDEKIGGHAFLIIGFVKNSDLPDGISHAEEEGYFIVKNSWGISAGDCGYLYVDYKYMRKEVTSLHTISSSDLKIKMKLPPLVRGGFYTSCKTLSSGSLN